MITLTKGSSRIAFSPAMAEYQRAMQSPEFSSLVQQARSDRGQVNGLIIADWLEEHDFPHLSAVVRKDPETFAGPQPPDREQLDLSRTPGNHRGQISRVPDHTVIVHSITPLKNADRYVGQESIDLGGIDEDRPYQQRVSLMVDLVVSRPDQPNRITHRREEWAIFVERLKRGAYRLAPEAWASYRRVAQEIGRNRTRQDRTQDYFNYSTNGPRQPQHYDGDWFANTPIDYDEPFPKPREGSSMNRQQRVASQLRTVIANPGIRQQLEKDIRGGDDLAKLAWADLADEDQTHPHYGKSQELHHMIGTHNKLIEHQKARPSPNQASAIELDHHDSLGVKHVLDHREALEPLKRELPHDSPFWMRARFPGPPQDDVPFAEQHSMNARTYGHNNLRDMVNREILRTIRQMPDSADSHEDGGELLNDVRGDVGAYLRQEHPNQQEISQRHVIEAVEHVLRTVYHLPRS